MVGSSTTFLSGALSKRFGEVVLDDEDAADRGFVKIVFFSRFDVDI